VANNRTKRSAPAGRTGRAGSWRSWPASWTRSGFLKAASASPQKQLRGLFLRRRAAGDRGGQGRRTALYEKCLAPARSVPSSTGARRRLEE